METKNIPSRYSEEDIKKILNLKKLGKSTSQISAELNRSRGSVANILWAYEHFNKLFELDNTEPAKPKKMTYREMIKTLYDAGYRIENNELVCYVRQVVKINDVIKG